MYLKIIKSLSYDNKYTKWYCAIVEKAQERVAQSKRRQTQRTMAVNILGAVEGHHIVPRSILSALPDNRVLNNAFLTHKEHFICHLLLPKMLIDKDSVGKMWYAINRLSTKFKHNSVAYSIMKNKFLEVAAKDARQYYIDYPEERQRVARVFRKAHENIDHSTKEWTERSFNSKESLKKSKEYSQTEENRNKCSERELSKGKEALIIQAKRGAQAQRNSFESEEDYRKYLGDINKGRKRIVNLLTLEVKQIRDTELPEGWKFWSDLDEKTKKLFVRKAPDHSNTPKKNWYHHPEIFDRPIKVLVDDIPPIGFIPGRGPRELWSINKHKETI